MQFPDAETAKNAGCVEAFGGARGRKASKAIKYDMWSYIYGYQALVK
jgi:hypothetical protein